MINRSTPFAAGETHDLIADDFSIGGSVIAVAGFIDFPNTVVSQAANLTALGRNDLVKQSKLCVTSVHHIQPIGFEHFGQHRSLVVFAAAVGC